jgi:hypothetical protein
MIDLGALKIGVKVDREGAEQELSGLQGKVADVQSKFGNFGKTLATGAAIGSAAVVSATGALMGMATKSAETTDRIDKMSQKLGMSKQGFQEWDYILGQNGISIDSLGGGMKALTNMTDELAKGSKTATDSFGRLGISFDDLQGKTQEEIFDITVRKLMEVEDQTERAALANDLLGRSGAELAPFLNQGAEGMDALRERAQELGLVLSDDAVNAGVVFGDTLDDLKRSFGTVVAQIGVEVMPMFQNLMDWVLAHMPEIKEFTSNAFKVIGEAVKIAWDIFANYLLPVFDAILGWVKDNWPLISGIIKTAFEVIKTVWDNILSPVLGFVWDAFKKVTDFISDNFPGMQKTVETVFGGIGKAVEGVFGIFKTLIDWVGKALDAWKKWTSRPDDKSGSGGNGGISGGIRDFVDGRHASGLDYVPYDGYIAELHKGERVLTAKEATQGTTMNHTGTITVKGVKDSGELTAVVDIVMDQLRREVRLA